LLAPASRLHGSGGIGLGSLTRMYIIQSVSAQSVPSSTCKHKAQLRQGKHMVTCQHTLPTHTCCVKVRAWSRQRVCVCVCVCVCV
jgi:hypothetical protein